LLWTGAGGGERTLLDVFLNDAKSNQRRHVLDSIPIVAKGRAPMDAVPIGKNVFLELFGVN
jgi:hypothetical protein